MSRDKSVARSLVVFLCGARDFHAMDWFASARQTLPGEQICLLTDLIAGEGFKNLIREGDRVYRLIVLDRFLLRYQSSFGNIWRNVLKLLVFPAQVFLLKKFSRQHPEATYFCHSMYYLFLAWAAGVHYVGTPQGSDILVKPYRSRLYKYFSIKSIQAAAHVTVDSRKMQQKILELSGVRALVIQNGIDVKSIFEYLQLHQRVPANERYILSIRGFHELYRIHEILEARNRSARFPEVPVAIRYPFYEANYRALSLALAKPIDNDVGRVEADDVYRIFAEARLVVAIPRSDSSPKSVYEAIFCGCPVAIAHHPYFDDLPACMQARMILVDLADPLWLDLAIDQADRIRQIPYEPTPAAISAFDKIESFKTMCKLLFS